MIYTFRKYVIGLMALTLVLCLNNSCKFFSSQPKVEPPFEFIGVQGVNSIITDHYQVSHQPGVYLKAFDLTFKSDSAVDLYYTLNGRKPKPGKDYTFKYIKPLHISEQGLAQHEFYRIPTSKLKDAGHFDWHEADSCRVGNSLKIKAFISDSSVSKTKVYSYFVQPKSHHSFPIISLTADHKKLWSHKKGMFMPGVNYDSTSTKWTGNFFMDWEIPCYIEFFSKQGERQFADKVDLRIHGLKSPMAPQKSIRLYERKKYGNEYYSQSFFADDTITKQKRVVLRTFFSSWGRHINADAIVTEIAKSFDVDVANSAPVILYVNGEYWGIENLREKMDKQYLAEHYQLNPDSIDIVICNYRAKSGSNKDYIELCEFIQKNDLSVDSILQTVMDHFDRTSLIDYFILQTYFNNGDWPGNNHVLWKSNKKGSKWRYLFYDLDATFFGVHRNRIADATALYEKDKINKGALVFGNLMKNKKFKEEFLFRYREAMNTLLAEEEVIKMINEFEKLYAYDMQEHIHRWHYPESMDSWMEKNEEMRAFARDRKSFMLDHLEEL
ncbi:MAG: CotH kinase family protein [Flavobacteriales bacterium]|nr:CotH kinase family protein [Flavobacteriales bacterium]